MPALWKSALLGYFWTSVVLNYYHIWNHQPQVCIFAKFCQKNKNVYVMEKCLFVYFWTLIVLNYCHVWNYQPQVCIFAKFWNIGLQLYLQNFATK